MKVPLLDFPKVDSRPVGTPYNQGDVRSGTEALAQGAERLSSGLEQLGEGYRKAQERADAVAATDAETEYQHAITSALSGNAEEPNIGPGFLTTRGRAAVGESGPTLEGLSDVRQKLTEGLANDNQKRIFQLRSGGLYEDARRHVENHVSTQIQEAEVASLKGRSETALTAIANNFADPMEVARQTAAVEGPIRALQLSKEDGDAKLAAWHQEIAKVRLNQYFAARDWRGGEALFAQVKEQLGPQAPQFEKVLQQVKQDQEGESNAQAIFQAAVDPATRWVNQEKARAEVDKMAPGPVKDETRQRLEHRLEKAKADKADVVDSVFNRALSSYERGGSTLTAVDARDRAFLQDASNDPKAWEKLRAIARADAEHARNAPPTPEQERAMTAFLVDVQDHPDKYATMSEPQYSATWLPQLAKRDREAAARVFAGTHKQPVAALSPTESKIVIEVGRNAGVFPAKGNDPSTWDLDQSKVLNAMHQRLVDKQAEYRQTNGKPPPLDVVEGWAAEMVIKGKVPGSGILWDTRTTRLEAELQGKPFEPKASAIPDEERRQIEAALSARGKPTTDENVVRLYSLSHGLPVAPAKAETPPEPVATPAPAPESEVPTAPTEAP